MSKIAQLIEELCPDGVEYKELGELIDYEQPSKYLVSSTTYDDTYPIPVLTAGTSFILGYTNESNNIYQANQDIPVIIFDDFTTSYHWVSFNFKIKSSAIKLLRPKEKTTNHFRYIYYAMKCINYIPQEHARQWISQYSKFKIPLPPLPIQEEIVRILDTFTETVAELQAELQARKKQYEYYREKLLTFETGDVQYVELGEVCEYIFAGGTPNTSKNEYWINGNIPWMSSGEIHNKRIVSTQKYITELGLANSSTKIVPLHSVLIALAGQGKTRGCVAINEIELCTNQSIASLTPIRNKLYYKYLYYNLCNRYYELREISSGDGNRGGLNLQIIKKIKIPLPSLSEQERIVSILDRFDALTNSITEGLPAEIEARQKQYEYYRDTLLTFKKKGISP